MTQTTQAAQTLLPEQQRIRTPLYRLLIRLVWALVLAQEWVQILRVWVQILLAWAQVVILVQAPARALKRNKFS
ncbi:MAG: hypothetical protein ICV84_22680 [Flavisolibacter sp.]|nr:hypothetical protein [Flavisolibacter sp.]